MELELPLRVVFVFAVACKTSLSDWEEAPKRLLLLLMLESYSKLESSTVLSVLKTSFSEFTLLEPASDSTLFRLESLTLFSSDLSETLESDNSSEPDMDAESSISIAETDEIKQNPIIKTAKSNVRFLLEIISPHTLEQS